MYFDPLSAWLVTLIADGIVAAGYHGHSGSSVLSELDRQRVAMLNSDIRRVKEKYGLILPDLAYKQIEVHIKTTKSAMSTNAPIIIDLDNQEYIISVLEAAAKWYSRNSSLDEYRKKAEWYKNAAIEARKRKEQYIKALEIKRIKNAAKRAKWQKINKICFFAGMIIIIMAILFFYL